LDLFLSQSVRVIGDSDLFGDTFGFLNSRDIHDSVGINFESDFDLRSSSWSWWNTIQTEFTQFVVVLGVGSLTFEDLDLDTWLIILESGEDLAFLRWDVGLPWDQSGHDFSSSFDTETQWNGIDDQHLIELLTSLTTDDSGLDSSTHGNCLIRVD